MVPFAVLFLEQIVSNRSEKHETEASMMVLCTKSASFTFC
jgi:hypothetical protein